MKLDGTGMERPGWCLLWSKDQVTGEFRRRVFRNKGEKLTWNNPKSKIVGNQLALGFYLRGESKQGLRETDFLLIQISSFWEKSSVYVCPQCLEFFFNFSLQGLTSVSVEHI